MSELNELEMEDLLGRVTSLTRELLEEGGEPHAVAFALATTAADMGLAVTESPMQVFPLLLKAIALQADRRLEAEAESEEDNADMDDVDCRDAVAASGATIH